MDMSYEQEIISLWCEQKTDYIQWKPSLEQTTERSLRVISSTVFNVERLAIFLIEQIDQNPKETKCFLNALFLRLAEDLDLVDERLLVKPENKGSDLDFFRGQHSLNLLARFLGLIATNQTLREIIKAFPYEFIIEKIEGPFPLKEAEEDKRLEVGELRIRCDFRLPESHLRENVLDSSTRTRGSEYSKRKERLRESYSE